MDALAPLRIQVLGGFSVQVGNRSIPAASWRLRAAALLVKLLALEPGRRLHREELLEALWPEADPQAANRNLRYCLHTARHLLDPSGDLGDVYLRRDGDYLRLELGDGGAVDVAEFEAAARDAERAGDVDGYGRAVARYTGELLPDDRYDDHIERRRLALHARYTDLLRQLATRLRAEGRLDAAVETLQRLLAAEPADEPAHLALMELYTRRGEDGRALAQYERLAEVLRQELDAAPGPAAERLAASIRVAGPGRSPVPGVPRLAPLDDSALVGRGRERQELRQALERALAGHGSLVLLSGEAGIGKTALAQDLAAVAIRAGCLVLGGGCYDLSVTPPYGLWLDLVRHYQPGDWLPPLPGFVRDRDALQALPSQDALWQQSARFFGEIAARQPLLLLLEDLHWSDGPSLELLRYLSRDIANQRILLLATYRDDEPNERNLLPPLLPTLLREASTVRLSLRRLDDEAQAALIANHYALGASDAARLLAYLAEHAQGNPFFTLELLRSLEEEGRLAPGDDGWSLGDLTGLRVPGVVRQVVEQRLARVDERARYHLQLAAVIGQTVPLDLWAAVTGAEDPVLVESLRAARAAHLIEESPAGDAFHFRHALVRETIYDGIVSLQRRAWHRAVAVALSEVERPVPDAVAHHFQQAGDPRAVDWLIEAGERAGRAFAWRMALDRFETAGELLRDNPARVSEAGWLLYRCGRLSVYFDPARGIELLDKALRIAAESSDHKLAALSHFRRGHLLCYLGDLKQGIDEMRRGVDTLDPILSEGLVGARVERFNPYRGTLLLWLSNGGYSRECIAIGERYLTELEKFSDAELLQVESDWPNGLSGLQNAYSLLGEAELGLEFSERAARAWHLVGHAAMESNTRSIVLEYAALPYLTDDLARREALARDAEAVWARAQGALGQELQGKSQRLPLLFVEGRWPEAMELRNYYFKAHTNAGRRMSAHVVFGNIARHRGEREAAWEHVRQGLPQGPATEPGSCMYHAAANLLRLAAWLALDDGDLNTARGWLEAHDRWLEWSEAVEGRAEGVLLWAEYHRQSGDAALALRTPREALALASEPRQPLVLIKVHRELGRLLLESQPDEAESHLRQALELARACAAPFEEAQTKPALAGLALRREERETARLLLEEVRAVAARLGARPLLAEVERLEQARPRRSRHAAKRATA